jgi:hypothetical protein
MKKYRDYPLYDTNGNIAATLTRQAVKDRKRKNKQQGKSRKLNRP